MRTRTIISAVAAASVLFQIACSEPPPVDTPPPSPTEIRVAGVYLNSQKLSITAGQSETLVATITPSSATNKNLAWSSGSSSVAAVDSSGRVTGVAAGTTRITVSTSDGDFTATCTVTVAAGAVAVTGVTLDKTELRIDVDGQETLTAKIVPASATNKAVKWSSSAPEVAKVDSEGKVTAIRAGGTATITCTTEDGRKTADCTVTVTAQDPNNILRATNFPDPVFFDYCRKQLSKWDSNRDGKLYAEEARAVKSIDVANIYGNAIGSLAGIEYFTGITYLDCSLNNLSSLDVSRNTSLNELYCNNNSRLASLDVSGFTALTVLNCSSCALTELDLTRCTRLVDLRCYNNDLSALDLSRCTALTYLDVDGNSLRTLNLSSNRALKGLICDNNSLTELDLSSCTALASLDCYNNDIVRLDLSKNRELISVSCDVNRLSSLDISQNIALESLVCNGNGLTSIMIGASNERLRYIHSSSNRLTSAALNTVFEALPASGTIAIYDNPGATTCDVSIAQKKNWTVMTN